MAMAIVEAGILIRLVKCIRKLSLGGLSTTDCYLWCCGGCLCSFTWPSCWSIAIECIVCEKSDVFLPSHGRNMGQQESYKGWFCSEPLHNLSMKLDDFMDSVGLYVLVHLRQTNT
ncbi:uncharacterized protein LOC110024010 isoform X6 [Phalaenopsis equestris]|uniref:uncharacterized protein LOC110024010 isoform X6 n=1 Tax=Phalaenopsis equestris TaxID=78828 RepID=UPI0009E209AB|nr:uncharacterized protein LOC110024010 isoform X6 [Phalaenopsis equestris]XP_020579380.1 uncharacterized protein LOC110024010 isoform X6 [Phalaenopsis equestris]